jgi:hypothetical protein
MSEIVNVSQIGRRKLEETRRQIEAGWEQVRHILVREGQARLATQVELFVRAMNPVQTEKEQMAAKLLRSARLSLSQPFLQA